MPKPKQNKHPHKHVLLGALTGIFFILLGVVAYLIIQKSIEERNQVTQQSLETNRTIVKVLPEEFKQQLKTASPTATFRVPILMYHYVEYVKDRKDKIRISLNIPPSVFEQQIVTLKDAGYTFMTAKDLGDVLDGKKQMPAKPVLLTFDDGHWDFATDVLPILKKYDVKATNYVISGFIGGSDFMTSQELQEVIASGLVDVGAHTVHHLALKGRLLNVVQNEVGQSKRMLEDTYHIKVVSFAYPYGSFDQQAVKVVKDEGFTTAVSTVPGIEQNQTNRYFLYRIRPGYRTGQILLNYLSQSYFRAY